MLSEVQKKALKEIVKAAKRSQDATGCPAALTTAQAILESGWGSRIPNNNAFGIKSYKGAYGIQLVPTWEVENGKRVSRLLPFATFHTLSDCFDKHASLITLTYRQAWANYVKSKSIEGLIRDIAPGNPTRPKYATDPQYASKLFQILNMPDVKAEIGDSHVPAK